jgi:hypothetical protein
MLKEQYKKDFDTINPDENMISELALKMKKRALPMRTPAAH